MPTRPGRYVIGVNWKMNLPSSDAREYFRRLLPMVDGIVDRELFVLPPHPSLWVAREQLAGTSIAWGAQDVHPEDRGAHTGDVSAPMLSDLGCRYVLVGHPERERDYNETIELVARKVAAIVRWGMVPIFSVGEKRRQRPETALAEVLLRIERSLANVSLDSMDGFIVAYEPGWAIGDGATSASPDEIAYMHRGIQARLRSRGLAPRHTHVIYGGSVDQSVAEQILSQEGVDGLFIGRHGLDPEVFAALARTPTSRVTAEPDGGAQTGAMRRVDGQLGIVAADSE